MEFCRQFIWECPWNQQKWVCKKQEHAKARMSQDLANTSVSREALSWKGNWQTATPPTGGTSASVLPGASSGHHYTHYGCIFIILTFSCVITALNCFNTDLGQIGNNVKQFSYNTKLMANLMKNNISLRHLLP